MFIIFDVSLYVDGLGILMGFVDVCGFDLLFIEECCCDVLCCFVLLFGDEVFDFFDYVDYCWGIEEFVLGGLIVVVLLGLWMKYGYWLCELVGLIYWVSIEIVDEWIGYFDGVVRFG